MASIFSRIVVGDIPSYKVAEDDRHYAFLDINPVAEGHTLVIPKREIDSIFDLADGEYADLQLFAKRVAESMKRVLPCKRIGVAVMGMEVPHAHIHLVPLNSEGDLNFFRDKLSLPAERMAEIAESIAVDFATNNTVD